MDELEIIAPDDWHVHLRDGDDLMAVAPWTAKFFRRAIVMPNLKPAITSTELAKSYRQRILAAIPKDVPFDPLMTIYLTNTTDPQDLAEGLKSGVVTAAKLYPVNATTNSEAGVTDIKKIFPALEVLSDLGRPLLVHAESADPDVDVFDREAVFIEKVLRPILRQFPKLKVVVEHITTEEAVEFVKQKRAQVAATITAHHLLINRNAMFQRGIRPHYYCLPVAKREKHRLALVAAATSGEDCFFLGTDSAPHSRQKKEAECGCAGIFSAPTALSLYAEVFASKGLLNRLEGFASRFGPKFYELPVNKEKIRLKRHSEKAPATVDLGNGEHVVVFEGDRPLSYSRV